MIFPAVTLAVALTAAPAPTATPHLKVIEHIKASASCTTLRKLMAPVSYVATTNEHAFNYMNNSMWKYVGSIIPTDVPGAAESMTAGQTLKDAPFPDPNNNDDATVYTPQGMQTATQVGKVAYDIFQNLVLADKYMTESWKEYPAGTDPKVDALRQRAQNLLDLQYAMANRYYSFSELYLDNKGANGNKTPTDSAQYKTMLRMLVMKQAEALAVARAEGASPKIMKEVSSFKKYAGTISLSKQLRTQEIVFARDAVTTLNDCTDTKTALPNGPSPSPLP